MLRILCLALVTLVVPQLAAAEEGELSVVLVPTQAKGGPNLKAQVKKSLEKALKKRTQVVALPLYQKAAKRLKIKGKAVFALDSAAQIGTEVGVSHVCIVEGQVETQQLSKKKKKKIFFANLTLVDVKSGDVSFTKRYELKGKAIPAALGATMVEDLAGAMTMAAEPPAPAEPDAPPPPLPEPPPPAPEPGPETPPPLPEPPPEPTPVASATEPPVEPPPEEPVVTSAPMVSSLLSPMGGETTTLTLTDDSSTSRRRKRWRPALHLGLGGAFNLRTATTKSPTGKPPGYEGPLPGGFVRLEFYPLAIGGRGSWYEGLGLHAEGGYTRIETEIDQISKETVQSDVIAANGGLSVRLVFWDSSTAPDFNLRAGYGIFYFPLAKGAFPGAKYAGPYAGGRFTIPFIEQVGLVLGGHVVPMVQTSGKLKRWGNDKSGLAFRAEGGLRLFFDPFELYAVGRFEQWGTTYRGTSDLPNVINQYNNVKMTDQLLGGYVTAGIAF